VQLLRVTDRDSRLFGEAMAIIRESISGNTQLPQARLEHLFANGRYQLFAYESREGAEGAALVYFAEQLRFVWLDYTAIRPRLRGKGLGSALFREIAGLAVNHNTPPDWLLLEVDDDREGDAQHQATCARRIGFYRRLGAQLLENVRYCFPSAYGPPLPMRLMAYSLRPNVALTSDALRSAVREVFEEIHGRRRDDELLRWFQSNLPDEIEMK